jgi:DNA replication protein DnaC
MPADSTMERTREKQKQADRSMPAPVTCGLCRNKFKPAYDSFEGKWKYPDMVIISSKSGETNGLCKSCRRLVHIRENMVVYLKKSGVPPKYFDCSFETFEINADISNAYKICHEYIVEPAGNLFLYGGYGTGKTHMAVAISRELLLHGKEIHFTSVPHLLFEIRKAFKQNAYDTEDMYMEKYSSCPFLILDDLGLEKSSEWTRQTLDYIICERDNHLRPTIITSNFSLDELTERMDGRISSRIAGMGKVILFKGEDYRLRRNR